MSFKLDALSAPLPRLSGYSVLELAGRDAEAFAQAQFTTDVKQLTPGRWQWSAWLTAKGRVVALFALVRVDAERLWLVLPDFPAAELAARLQRFVFRSKVALTSRADLEVVAVPSEGLAGTANWQGAPDTGLYLDLSAEGDARALAILPADASTIVEARPEIDAAWRLADIRHGLPRLGPDQVEAWTPHMLSLERLHAVSVKKGCYPGQEIVARTHFLGQAKRVLHRLAVPALDGGQIELRDAAGQAQGRSVCTAPADNGFEVLAVLPAEPAKGPLFAAGGGEALMLPLLGGLERQP